MSKGFRRTRKSGFERDDRAFTDKENLLLSLTMQTLPRRALCVKIMVT
jgi:hypothetical protein